LVFMKKYLLIIFACALMVETASAQVSVPQVLVNWQASTYVPTSFKGKALPTGSSQITVGVDLLNQGQRVNLAGQRVLWYINDNFYQGSPGLSRVTFQAPNFIGSTSVNLRVSIPDYGSGPAKTIVIPIVNPEVVIGTSAPGLSASAVPFTLQAFPYFWNVQNPLELQFRWSASGMGTVSQNPLTVTSAMAQSGRPLSLELSVSNPTRSVERITRDITLFPSR
jgi:hypothetical protein